MRRRDLIKGIAGSAAAWPLAAHAQQPAKSVIGLVQIGSASSYDLSGFRQGLGDKGYVEGQNLEIEYRFADDNETHLPELVSDLVRHQVRVIATVGSALTARAAKDATNAIPIVFGFGADPVKLGLVSSLNRPGGNVTGVISLSNELFGKQLGMLHDLLPQALRFGVLAHPRSPFHESIVRDTQAAASRLALAVEILDGAGGFPGFVATLFPEGRELRGAERALITFEVAADRAQWGTDIAGKVRAWAKALIGSTSLPGKYPQLMNPPGSETGPGQLVTCGKSTMCTVDAFGFKFQWTTNSSKHIPFDWTGPGQFAPA
jgi:hypothetical protein